VYLLNGSSAAPEQRLNVDIEHSNTVQTNENLHDRVEELEDEVAAGERTDTAHRATALRLQDALDYFQSIVDTVREPMLVLDDALRVRTASQAFYDTFAVAPDKTIGQYVYDLGNGQWGIPNLRTLLEQILPKDHIF
jgi:PAS domain-containing protein